MMQAAAEAARDAAAAAGRQPPLVIGVTVLTSMNADGLTEVGAATPVIEQVERFARLARQAGLDGVVASPQETTLIRRACGEALRDRDAGDPGRRGGERERRPGTDDDGG